MGTRVVGVDVGGTNVRTIAIDKVTREVTGQNKCPTSQHGPSLVEIVKDLIENLPKASVEKCAAIGLGLAGLVDSSGMVQYSPNLPGLTGFPIGPRLEEALGIPILAGNDATAATIAEWRLGAGMGVDNFTMVTLGTGIGTGFVVDGQLLRGATGFAGESGHMVIRGDGPTHRTGQAGPWEYFASGTALDRLGREAATSGSFPWGVATAGTSDAVTGKTVAAGIALGESDALGIFDEFCREVSTGLANLVLILDCELVVVGGGLCDIGKPLRTGIERWLQKLLLGAKYRPVVRVELAEFGPEAGALGASLMAAEALDGA